MELQGQEFWPLSGKPYFHVVLSKSNLKPSYHLTVSAEIQKVVPSLEIPTLLIFKDNEWQMVYQGQSKHKKFDGWKSFAMDNKLEIGDACVFELLDYSTQEIRCS
ncbi:B3 domain-containing protein Os04g0386900-like isoform X2 [Mangifera indica]|uniref:B3 domain-containing protein Os04g0386900-like isoform X2 n=1 Tax=Mangifera indica TaxID=29780 RepID=UPI001CF9A7F5|nr:B3 domain-containing protein Os04g0386900-like isoform X2 [Mangifera indica]